MVGFCIAVGRNTRARHNGGDRHILNGGVIMGFDYGEEKENEDFLVEYERKVKEEAEGDIEW